MRKPRPKPVAKGLWARTVIRQMHSVMPQIGNHGEGDISASTESVKVGAVNRVNDSFVNFFRFAPIRLSFMTFAAFASAGLEVVVLWSLIKLVMTLIGQDSDGRSFKAPGLGSASAFNVSIEAILLIGITSVLLRVALDLYRAYSLTGILADFERNQRDSLCAAYFRSSYERQCAEKAGHLQTLLGEHLYYARALLTGLVTGVGACGTLLIFAGAAAFIDGIAIIFLLAILLGLFACLRPLSLWIRRLSHEYGANCVTFNNTLNQGIAVSRELKVFNVTERFVQQLHNQSGQIQRLRWLSSFFGMLVPTLYQSSAFLILMVSIGAVYYTGVGQIGSLGLVILLLVRGYSYGQVFQSAYHSIQECLPYLDQLAFAQAEYAASEVDVSGVSLTPIDLLEFDHVTFTYPGERLGLHDLNVCFRRGEIVAIVGPSGSGKSTLMQLLLRLRKPSTGSINVDGVSAAEFSLQSWYQRVSFVPQEPHFFDHTIREAIRFFRPEITDEAIEQAARTVGIEQEILAFPKGFDTRVGEGGLSLSGGQRQRLCLARALVSNPDLLVLDEPTSALDSYSEKMVLDSLNQCKGKITTIIIGHRLSMLDICDRVLGLREGRLQFDGFPSEYRSPGLTNGSALQPAVHA